MRAPSACDDRAVTLAEALERSATGYEIAAGFAHGEVGATLVRHPTGGEAVAKWLAPVAAEELAALGTAIALVDRLRERGASVPRYAGLLELGPGVLVLQERLPGTPHTTVGPDLVADLLAHNGLQEGLGPSAGGWTAYVTASLRDGLTGYCEHASLATHSAATRRLLARIRGAGEALAGRRLVENDAVHLDFHHLNVLQRDGRLSGIVDNEGTRGGDRIFDLVTLAFCLAEADCPPGTVARVWETANAARDRVTLRAYVAHMALRQVDWSIRHRTEEDVRRWMAHTDDAWTMLS